MTFFEQNTDVINTRAAQMTNHGYFYNGIREIRDIEFRLQKNSATESLIMAGFVERKCACECKTGLPQKSKLSVFRSKSENNNN